MSLVGWLPIFCECKGFSKISVQNCKKRAGDFRPLIYMKYLANQCQNEEFLKVSRHLLVIFGHRDWTFHQVPWLSITFHVLPWGSTFCSNKEWTGRLLLFVRNREMTKKYNVQVHELLIYFLILSFSVGRQRYFIYMTKLYWLGTAE